MGKELLEWSIEDDITTIGSTGARLWDIKDRLDMIARDIMKVLG